MKPSLPTPTEGGPRRLRLPRRRFLQALLLGTPAVALADGFWIEPNWLAVRKLNLANGVPRHRFVFFTDLHHKGDRRRLDSLVHRINALSPEFVCFGGDLVEDGEHLEDALAGLKQVQSPLYGVPGNHDYWSHADFDRIGEVFAETGGRWLVDEVVDAAGAGCRSPEPPARSRPILSSVRIGAASR